MAISCLCSASSPAAASHTRNAQKLRNSAFVLQRPSVHGPRRHSSDANGRPLRFEVEAKGKGKKRARMGGYQQVAQEPPTPPVDPNNTEFVIFARSVALKRWFPLSIMKGGTQANMLVKSLDAKIGREMFKNTLVRNIAAALYKEKDEIIKNIQEQIPGMKHIKEFEFGFKIRDKQDPKSWWKPENVIELPQEGEVEKSPVDKAKDWFGNLTSGVKLGQPQETNQFLACCKDNIVDKFVTTTRHTPITAVRGHADR